MSNKKYEVRHKYDSTAEQYENRYTAIQKQKYFEIFSDIDFEKKTIVYDVGGGTGLLLNYLKQDNVTIIVSDISLEMLKVGRNKYPLGFFVCADSEFLPFREESGDFVTCISVVQNLVNPQKTIDECHDMVRKKGYLVLTALKKIFNIKSLKNIVKKSGFKIIKSWNLSIEDIVLIARKE
ncbi:MAG: class I SAM-dependent methyltransferase [Candidatus Heimdallarchaeota archaeon]|nr:class I SAM-dependent methyltransferase [Candidatus Heimdallarchaeota archaeon]MCG3255930.1 class I SAM-dependent methyltransferase [Candidatus Heimdallarchaeota archaeon]MCK4611001.1 class I SAM-dependent methyltransferase [Candidatus Heimdallarchaeota archaeon]